MEERQSNISTFIGIGLIFLLLFLWMRTSQPPKQPEQTTTEQNAQQPSQAAPATNTPAQQAPAPVTGDSASQAMTNAKFGAFAAASMGKEQTTILENDLVKVTFSNKGGRIQEVFLKKFEKISVDTAGKEIKNPVRLLEDNKNRFEYELPVNNTASGKVLSSDLYFTPSVNGNTISFRADAGQGRYFEQRYTVRPNDYTIDYQITGNGLQSVLSQQQLRFNWLNHLDKLEKNQTYERTMSSVYFKKTDASSDYCDCRKNVTESLGQVPVQWFAHSNQFFNTAVVANGFNFTDFTGETMMLTDADPDLKLLHSTATIPFESGMASMTIYSGPNEFERLRAFGVQLEDIIPFGASVFGAINRWVIHPIFDILQNIIGIPGIVILILTLLVKLLLYPLTYRMVLSQSKMAALKPQLEGLKKKHGDDQQAMSVETMKLYSTYGVNPLGGCLPVFLQMPIWFALYRFFPAAIEFRQEGFLWAHDLSSFDVAFKLPFMMPGFGNHISAFTLIWVVTTLWYTWYSMKQMDNSAIQNDQMKIMKYMQYFMPVMFMFFFNSFASGLTLYLCFSNILNIGQTVVTKRYLINHDKINVQLEKNRQKPKKETGFRARLEQAMKEQQRVQEEKAKQQKKK